MFRVTRPYLNLLAKPSVKNLEYFSAFLEKYNLCILKGQMPFKMHKIIYFSRIFFFFFFKFVCLFYLKFSDPLPKTHIYFLFGLMLILQSYIISYSIHTFKATQLALYRLFFVNLQQSGSIPLSWQIDFSIQFYTMNFAWPIIYFEGS